MNRFLRKFIFSRYWLGVLPVAVIVFVVSCLLEAYVVGNSASQVLAYAGRGVLLAVWCYGVGMCQVALQSRDNADETEDDREEVNSPFTWQGWLVLTLIILIFLGWLFRTTLSYWWGTGSFEQAVTGPVRRLLFLGAYAVPVVWNRRCDK